ncbi:LysR family transcriptional regulator [uncultured Ruegeria sp.]|uniref:LysR family transcriptional regulator n=1 Tax=uncultured Ruegeria sp. TaxID=259304 RepID=UPI00263033B5|nr:LysR family transcriptional regulator [uncultured Ruegeria sp.]
MGKIPSIRALRVFEAANRMGSYSLAAHKMGITQSAVSRQIKSLESELGVKLFFKEGRNVKLASYAEEFAGHCQLVCTRLTAV